jgi:hypothetical protein
MALALLLATAGREELSAPMPCLVQPGTAVARDAAVEGSGDTMSIRSRAGQGETGFSMFCLGLSKTPFYLSFSFLPLFFSCLSQAQDSFIFVYFCSCMLAWRAFFPLSLNAYLMATI